MFADSLRRDLGAQAIEAALTDPAHHHEVFDAAESAVALAKIYDARSESRPYSGEFFELRSRRRIDVDEILGRTGRRAPAIKLVSPRSGPVVHSDTRS